MLDALLDEVRACRACADFLNLGPRPVVQITAAARILITNEAPGTNVHESGISFSDASEDRLRDWMGVPDETFYDERRVTILPMGVCYRGSSGNGGDAPPRAGCTPRWRDQLLAHMPDPWLTLLVDTHARNDALGRARWPSA